jgi:ketosteroid isomerase-like protein
MADLTPVIETMEHRWMRAWVARDAKELKRLTASDFILVMASKPAVVLDTKSWLEAAVKRYRCTSYRLGDIYVRRIGAIALFASQMELKVSMDGQDWSGRYFVTDVWRKGKVRRGWKLVERVLSRTEENPDVPAAIKSLQLWR